MPAPYHRPLRHQPDIPTERRDPGGEARAERRSHGLDYRPFVYSEITPILRPQQQPTGLGAKGLTLPQLAMPGKRWLFENPR